MAKKNANIKRLDTLKKKRVSKGKKKDYFSESIRNITSKLVREERPVDTSRQEAAVRDKAYRAAIAKNSSSVERLTDSVAETGKSRDREMRRQLSLLGKSVSKNSQQGVAVSGELRNAIINLQQKNDKLQKRDTAFRQRLQQEKQASAIAAEDTAIAEKAQKTAAAEKDAEVKAAEEAKRLEEVEKLKALIAAGAEGETASHFSFGPYSYKVGSTANNELVGTGYDAQGRKNSLPISIADGIIHSVAQQGDSYAVNVETPEGKVIRYAGIDNDVASSAERLVGRQVKKGDILYHTPNARGDGSVTISVSDLDEEGNISNNHQENEPIRYFLS